MLPTNRVSPPTYSQGPAAVETEEPPYVSSTLVFIGGGLLVCPSSTPSGRLEDSTVLEGPRCEVGMVDCKELA